MDDNFVLQTETAQQLYHEHAEKQPIIDYHCHLDPKQIAQNRRFDNLGQIRLEGDHYKWQTIFRDCRITATEKANWQKQFFTVSIPATMT